MCNKFGSAANTIVLFIFPFILTVLISSCVIVPYEPSPEVSVSGSSDLPAGEMVVRASPHELLEQISEVISEAQTRIEIVDPITFIEVAFPGRDKGLLRLFEDGNCQRISSELGVDYLVLIGDMENDTLRKVDAMGWFIVFFGVASGERETRLSATIIDIKNERPLHDVSSSARGTSGFVGYVALVGTRSDTESSAIKGLGRKIADIISNDSDSEIIRIAVLSAGKQDDTYLSNIEMEKALEVLQERARGGYPDAQWVLFNKQPTDENIIWLCRAADQGQTDARNELGNLYFYGSNIQHELLHIDITVDVSKACMWFHLSGTTDITKRTGKESKSDSAIFESLGLSGLLPKEICDSMSKEEHSLAVEMLRDWTPGTCEQELLR